MFTINGTIAVTITGLTVRDGKANYGGGVYVYGDSAALNGTQVISNSAEYGGGIYVWNSDATLNVSGGTLPTTRPPTMAAGCVLGVRRRSPWRTTRPAARPSIRCAVPVSC